MAAKKTKAKARKSPIKHNSLKRVSGGNTGLWEGFPPSKTRPVNKASLSDGDSISVNPDPLPD